MSIEEVYYKINICPVCENNFDHICFDVGKEVGHFVSSPNWYGYYDYNNGLALTTEKRIENISSYLRKLKSNTFHVYEEIYDFGFEIPYKDFLIKIKPENFKKLLILI